MTGSDAAAVAAWDEVSPEIRQATYVVIACFNEQGAVGVEGHHDPNDLPAMLLPIARGEVEICLGSRFLGAAENMPATRRIMLKGAVIFTRITSGLRLTDAHNGLRAFSRRAAEHLDLQLDRMAHASEIVDQVRTSALPYREIPVHIRYTDYSLAKGQRSSAALRVAMDYLIGRVLR